MDELFQPSINDCEKRLLKLYENILTDQNPVCTKCKSNNTDLTSPVGAWVVGNKFYSHSKRILFVGKNARGNLGKSYHGFQVVFSTARNCLWKKPWPYWNYTRAITDAVYGNDDIENIAFTNIVKCNDSDGKDSTSEHTKGCCICQLNVIGKEIDIIRPTHIVFYTSWKYDDYIPLIFDTYTEIEKRKVKIGKKEMPWMEAIGQLNDNLIKILRVGHPERMKKDEYVSAISKWIQL